jgi:predicted deacylase
MTRVTRRTIPYARLPDGGELTFPLIEIRGQAGPTVLFTGGIHGDEYEGPLALLDLAQGLADRPLAGRVLLVPFANAPALLAGTRTSPLDGENLARIFPGDPKGGPSARLAAALFALLDEVDLLVDSHSGGVDLCFLPVAGFYPAGEGVTAEVSRHSQALAAATGLADLWELPPRAGVLSFEAARRGIAATGCEVGGRGHAAPGDVATYRDAHLRLLAAQGMISASAAPPPAPVRRVLRGDWNPAPAAGLFRPLRRLGEAVRRDDPLARIETPLGEVLAELAAPRDGVLMAERNLCRVREGDLAILVAEPVTDWAAEDES